MVSLLTGSPEKDRLRKVQLIENVISEPDACGLLVPGLMFPARLPWVSLRTRENRYGRAEVCP